MSSPDERKTIQARILAYAVAIDWSLATWQAGSNGSTRQEVASPIAATALVNQ
jgi:hypothetical protein